MHICDLSCAHMMDIMNYDWKLSNCWQLHEFLNEIGIRVHDGVCK